MTTSADPNWAGLRADPSLAFAVSRHSICGTPVLWEEHIKFARGDEQRFSTLRSPADEGGIAIGNWSSTDDPALATELIDILERLKPWALPSEPVEPGEQLITWNFTLDTFTRQLSYPTRSVLCKKLGDLDMRMRRIANRLTRNKTGTSQSANLVCSAQVDSSRSVHAYLENRGTLPALVFNPFRARESWDDVNYVRVELAAAVAEPDLTGLGLVYKSVPTTFSCDAEPWQADYLLIDAGDQLELPLQAQLPAAAEVNGGYFRVVFSEYRPVNKTDADELAESTGAVQVRGRVFSTEEEQ